MTLWVISLWPWYSALSENSWKTWESMNWTPNWCSFHKYKFHQSEPHVFFFKQNLKCNRFLWNTRLKLSKKFSLSGLGKNVLAAIWYKGELIFFTYETIFVRIFAIKIFCPAFLSFLAEVNCTTVFLSWNVCFEKIYKFFELFKNFQLLLLFSSLWTKNLL